MSWGAAASRWENQLTQDLVDGWGWAPKSGQTCHRRFLIALSPHSMTTANKTGSYLHTRTLRRPPDSVYFGSWLKHSIRLTLFSQIPFPGLFGFSFLLSAPKNLHLSRLSSGAENWRKIPEHLGLTLGSSLFCCCCRGVSPAALKRKAQSSQQKSKKRYESARSAALLTL